ncbi:MAG: phosphatase PAP2 family protein, partial [FCB group bacterium]
YKTIGFVALESYSFLVDADSRRYELNHQSKTNYDLFNISNNFGVVTDEVIFGGVIYLGGLFTGSDVIRITGRQIFESMTLAGIFSLPMKFIFGRARPYNELGSMTFKPFNLHNNFNSMPSGHTVVAFSVASVLAFKIDTWWSYPLFGTIALSTGMARLYFDQHWLSDVVMSAFIGTLSGYAVIKAEKNMNNINKSSGQIIIYPSYNGIGIAYKM